MSDSNGNATRNRLSERLSDSSEATIGRPQGDGRLDRTAQRNVRRGHRSIFSLPLRVKTGRVLFGVAVVVVLVASLGFAAIANTETAADKLPRPRVLAVQTVSVQLVTSYLAAREYTGAIVARRASELGFELAGKLTEIYVDEGDSVAAGTALAVLDTEHLETRRRQIVARRAQAAAKLDEMIAGPRDEDIAAARARIEGLQAQVELLKRQTARREKLVASSATTVDEYEEYAFDSKARESQLNEAKHNLNELLNGTRKEQIEAQQAAVVELGAAIADIDVDLRKSTLKAPFAGTIARRMADDGTVVDKGQPVFRLVEDQVLEAWIGLPVHAAARLAEKSLQRAKIGGRYFGATVAGRFPEVDPATRTRTVVLRLDDSAAAHVIHGQVVRLELDETVEASGYWLPSTALTKGARGLWTSFVVVEAEKKGSGTIFRNGPEGAAQKRYLTPLSQPDLFRVERRDIEVLHTESDRVLVRGTLNSGDRVVTSGTHRVVPGQLVRLSK